MRTRAQQGMKPVRIFRHWGVGPVIALAVVWPAASPASNISQGLPDFSPESIAWFKAPSRIEMSLTPSPLVKLWKEWARDAERAWTQKFFEAIASGDQATFAAMLGAGIDPNLEFPDPPPADFVKRYRDDDTLHYYLSSEKGFTALMFAACLQNEAFVRALLDAGANPWKVTKRHQTFALWLAAKTQNIEIMRLLMKIGPTDSSRFYRIAIDLDAQQASVWHCGILVQQMPISSGRSSHPTPPGSYLITNKYRSWHSTIYPAKMPYFLRLSCGDFGLHAGYLPGYPASHGCIRLPEDDAKELFASVPIGTLVEIR